MYVYIIVSKISSVYYRKIAEEDISRNRLFAICYFSISATGLGWLCFRT